MHASCPAFAPSFRSSPVRWADGYERFKPWTTVNLSLGYRATDALSFNLAVVNVLGAVTGTRLALRGGTPLIRKLFLVLVVVLITRMAWDTFSGP